MQIENCFAREQLSGLVAERDRSSLKSEMYIVPSGFGQWIMLDTHSKIIIFFFFWLMFWNSKLRPLRCKWWLFASFVSKNFSEIELLNIYLVTIISIQFTSILMFVKLSQFVDRGSDIFEWSVTQMNYQSCQTWFLQNMVKLTILYDTAHSIAMLWEWDFRYYKIIRNSILARTNYPCSSLT